MSKKFCQPFFLYHFVYELRREENAEKNCIPHTAKKDANLLTDDTFIHETTDYLYV